jgi:hypothetical protein
VQSDGTLDEQTKRWGNEVRKLQRQGKGDFEKRALNERK